MSYYSQVPMPKNWYKPLTFDGPIAKFDGLTISFDDVVKRYAVTKEQLTQDAKGLRWKLIDGVKLFNLKQIRSKYQVDSDKLQALAKFEVDKEKPETNRRL